MRGTKPARHWSPPDRSCNTIRLIIWKQPQDHKGPAAVSVFEFDIGRRVMSARRLRPSRRTARCAFRTRRTLRRRSSSAGALSGFFVADHAADHQSDESAKNGDKNDIDEICAKPCQHVITSLEKGGQDAGNRGLRPRCPARWKGEKYRSLNGKHLCFFIGFEQLPDNQGQYGNCQDQSRDVHAAGEQAADLPYDKGCHPGKAALVPDGEPGPLAAVAHSRLKIIKVKAASLPCPPEKALKSSATRPQIWSPFSSSSSAPS